MGVASKMWPKLLEHCILQCFVSFCLFEIASSIGQKLLKHYKIQLFSFRELDVASYTWQKLREHCILQYFVSFYELGVASSIWQKLQKACKIGVRCKSIVCVASNILWPKLLEHCVLLATCGRSCSSIVFCYAFSALRHGIRQFFLN